MQLYSRLSRIFGSMYYKWINTRVTTRSFVHLWHVFRSKWTRETSDYQFKKRSSTFCYPYLKKAAYDDDPLSHKIRDKASKMGWRARLYRARVFEIAWSFRNVSRLIPEILELVARGSDRTRLLLSRYEEKSRWTLRSVLTIGDKPRRDKRTNAEQDWKWTGTDARYVDVFERGGWIFAVSFVKLKFR